MKREASIYSWDLPKSTVQIELHRRSILEPIYNWFALFALVTLVWLKCFTGLPMFQVDGFLHRLNKLGQFMWVKWTPFNKLTSIEYFVRNSHELWSTARDIMLYINFDFVQLYTSHFDLFNFYKTTNIIIDKTSFYVYILHTQIFIFIHYKK